MNTKRKVYEALSKGVKKVGLSAIADLEQAIGMNSVDSQSFQEVEDLDADGLKFNDAMDSVAFAMNPFIESYEWVEQNYDPSSLSNSLDRLEQAMGKFEELSLELGVDYIGNPTYEHAREAYDDLMSIMAKASDYLSRYKDTYGIAQSLKNI